MTRTFYRAFEDKHRGSRELIISRLSVYLPFVELLASTYPSARAIDLGCGRGEWLEVLASAGVESSGVDLDEGMLAACRERGFDVTLGDAVNFVKALPNESVVAVSGFHIAEHIAFSDLHELVREALRVLKPGGLLILETPNPENIAVGTWGFYMDPSHVRPIPPELLAFLPEYYGYARVKVLRLQEPAHLHGQTEVTFADVLGGVSPDYCVIAQKQADEDTLAKFDDVFARRYGVTLSELAAKYDHQAKARAEALGADLAKAKTIAEQAEVVALQAEARAAHMEAVVQASRAEMQTAQVRLEAVLTSRSWRVTAPLRWCGKLIRHVRGGAGGVALLKKGGRRAAGKLVGAFNARPTLRRRIVWLVQRLGLYERLRQHYRAATQRTAYSAPVDAWKAAEGEASLSPRARRIYSLLKGKSGSEREAS